MLKILNLAGVRFGRLVAILRAPHAKNKHTRWLCRCDCGRSLFVDTARLTSGKTKSCGCLRTELLLKRLTKHGAARQGKRTPEYNSWKSMWQRCTDSKQKNFKHYGGRGIKVCDRWRSFENFLVDMGRRPRGTSLDRKEVNGDYEPSNCRWLPRTEQMKTTRCLVRIEFNGATRTLEEWSKVIRCPKDCLRRRLNDGWPVERALTTPWQKQFGAKW